MLYPWPKRGGGGGGGGGDPRAVPAATRSSYVVILYAQLFKTYWGFDSLRQDAMVTHSSFPLSNLATLLQIPKCTSIKVTYTYIRVRCVVLQAGCIVSTVRWRSVRHEVEPRWRGLPDKSGLVWRYSETRVIKPPGGSARESRLNAQKK